MAAKLGRNDACWCGSGENIKNAMRHLMKTGAVQKEGVCGSDARNDKNKRADCKIKESCKINIAVLDYVEAISDMAFPQKRLTGGCMRRR